MKQINVPVLAPFTKKSLPFGMMTKLPMTRPSARESSVTQLLDTSGVIFTQLVEAGYLWEKYISGKGNATITKTRTVQYSNRYSIDQAASSEI